MIIALTLITGFYLFFLKPNTVPAQNLRIAQLDIPVEIATTLEEQGRGLSGRASLPASNGLLFTFPRPDYYQFWMPDMNFPIDIIWINNNAVVDITADASNVFNPKKPIFYTPNFPAQYVLEVNSGFAKRNNINIGDPVKIPNL